MSSIENKTNFDFIRYSNCWEDADILIEGLRVKKADNCLSICSAGDNTLSLLLCDPKLIIAVDINKTQLACLELKMAAFRNLNYNELLKLLGVINSKSRYELFNKIKANLSSDSKTFFENNKAIIEKGIMYAGKMEKYFNLFRKILIPFIYTKKTIKNILEAKDISSQRNIYYSKINNLRFKLFYNIFLSKFILGKLGRDPKFFDHVKGNVAVRLKQRIEYALTNQSTNKNPYLNFILRGKFTKQNLPNYLREENFNKIKKNIDKIKIFNGSVSQAIRYHSNLKFNAFNLSDIFEYMEWNEFISELKIIREASAQGARIAFWNNLTDRSIPENISGIKTNHKLSKELSIKDKVFYYDSFIIGELTLPIDKSRGFLGMIKGCFLMKV